MEFYHSSRKVTNVFPLNNRTETSLARIRRWITFCMYSVTLNEKMCDLDFVLCESGSPSTHETFYSKREVRNLQLTFSKEVAFLLWTILMRKEVWNFIVSILLKLWIITALLTITLYFRSAFQCSGPGQLVKSDASLLLPMRPCKVDSLSQQNNISPSFISVSS